MSIWEMSLSGAFVIMAILLLRRFFLHKIPKVTFIALWGIALLRLLIPVSVGSSVSIYRVIYWLQGLFLGYEMGGLTGIASNIGVTDVTKTSTMSNVFETSTIAKVFFQSSFLLVVLWFIGMLGMSLFFMITHFRNVKEYKMALPMEDEKMNSFIREYPVRGKVKIRQSDQVETAFTYGVFHPIIIFPKRAEWKEEDTLNFVLLHELTHIKYRDTLKKLLLTITLCVHWFNPFVWLMYRMANKDIELCCDEAVVRSLGEEKKSAYAMALITLEETRSHFSPFVSRFSKGAMEERITSIMKLKKSSFLGVVAALVFLISTPIVFATSPFQQVSDTIDEDAPYSIYEPYGMTYNAFTDKFYYKGKVVRFFYDDVAKLGFTNYYAGTIDLEPQYNNKKELEGLIPSTKEEYDARTIRHLSIINDESIGAIDSSVTPDEEMLKTTQQ